MIQYRLAFWSFCFWARLVMAYQFGLTWMVLWHQPVAIRPLVALGENLVAAAAEFDALTPKGPAATDPLRQWLAHVRARAGRT